MRMRARMRELDGYAFERAFGELSTRDCWQEEPSYYPRYRSRYEALTRRLAVIAPNQPLDVLDIGGGQLAFLAQRLWGDRGCVADISDSSFANLREEGLDAVVWNIAADDPPAGRSFDVIFLSEVIEHLPVPGHVVLERLRRILRPQGILICSTPNLYRLRNAVYLLRGKQIFDVFGLPGERGYGHVLEYSAEHLAWQFRRAGFTDYAVETVNFEHIPNGALDRSLARLGRPLSGMPRYRENVLAIARAN
jgi:SAM-dependent methyltransferase